MRSKEITFNGKKHTVQEQRVKDLNKLMDSMKDDFEKFTNLKSIEDLKDAILSILQDKLTLIVPGIKAEDIPEAYPSEIEGVLEAFLEVNFSGLRKLLGQLLSYAKIASR